MSYLRPGIGLGGVLELLDVEGPAVRRPSDVDVVKRHFDVWDPESCQASWMVRP